MKRINEVIRKEKKNRRSAVMYRWVSEWVSQRLLVDSSLLKWKEKREDVTSVYLTLSSNRLSRLLMLCPCCYTGPRGRMNGEEEERKRNEKNKLKSIRRRRRRQRRRRRNEKSNRWGQQQQQNRVWELKGRDCLCTRIAGRRAAAAWQEKEGGREKV